ncbi:hypothetical protein HY948_04850 [Candidatus Gottesmanbacteria bacterium]|nr:hypothetical protein [Candidatus Gottesmanbacteria bacterium]
MKTRWWLFVIIVFSLLPLWDLLHTGLPVTHDGQDHVTRIANFYQSLSEGHIVPRWAGNLNWGYGHPILMFLYPLPSYVASFFHFVGFSFVDATKLVFAAAYIISMIAMFVWAGSQWGSIAGLAASVLYGFAPYRFVDLYVRGAIGEHVAFVFLPLVLWGLLKLARSGNRRWGMVVAASTAGLLLSHNAISLMFFPVIFLYGVYLNFFETTQRRWFIVFGVWSIAIGFMLASFFWVPAFFEGKYTLRDIVTRGDFSDRFVPIQKFFFTPWNYGGGNELPKELGMAQWFVIMASAVTFFRSKKNVIRWMIGPLFISLALSIFLMIGWSSGIWQQVTILQKFQFPWRLLTLTVFFVSALGGVVVSSVRKTSRIMFCGIVLLASFAFTFPMWHAQAYSIKPESYYTSVYEGTTDTGESSPIWSVRFMEARSKAALEAVEGLVTVTELSRSTTRHRYRVIASQKAKLVENTLYFPGWEVAVDGKPVFVEFQNPEWRGLMTFEVPAGEHQVEVRFQETKLRKAANAISVVGAILLIL